MSLTSFLKQGDVQSIFTAQYPNQGIDATDTIKAEPVTTNYPLVGMAFDYLFRFQLEHDVPNVETTHWAAENGLQTLQQQNSPHTETARTLIKDAKNEHEKFLETGEITTELIEHTIHLSKIEVAYRSGFLRDELYPYDNGDIQDLKNLLEILQQTDLVNADNATLNPTFGIGSALVDGADADGIIDGCLIDIKTSKYAHFKPDYWKQLVGYCVLHDIHNTVAEMTDSTKIPEIETFGVYFSRFGQTKYLPTNIIYDDEDYEAFRAWFVQTALQKGAAPEAHLEEELLRETFCDPYDTSNIGPTTLNDF